MWGKQWNGEKTEKLFSLWGSSLWEEAEQSVSHTCMHALCSAPGKSIQVRQRSGWEWSKDSAPLRTHLQQGKPLSPGAHKGNTVVVLPRQNLGAPPSLSWYSSSLLSTDRFKAMMSSLTVTSCEKGSGKKIMKNAPFFFFFFSSSSSSKSVSLLWRAIDTKMQVCDALCQGHNDSFIFPICTSSKLCKKAGKHYVNGVMTV